MRRMPLDALILFTTAAVLSVAGVYGLYGLAWLIGP